MTHLASVSEYQSPQMDVEPTAKEVRVLVVEDDLSLQPLWNHIIHEAYPKARVDWATTEEVAERLIRQRFKRGRPYNLVISDVFLAGRKTGIDLWTRFGEAAGKFIFVSVLPKEKFEMLMADDMGYPIFLQKPLRPRLCKELVEELV